MKELIRFRADQELRNIVIRSSTKKGISMSNYIRNLILQDQQPSA
jgi:hypothetical protein